MRESVSFEVRLRRFDIWQAAVGFVGAAAVAALAAWLAAGWSAHDESGRLLASVVASPVALVTIGVAVSLARIDAGLLTCTDGVWTFAPDASARRSGTVEVAMDLGAFLLLRLVAGRQTLSWLPVQRRGLESQWHALRCAVYSPPPVAAVVAALPALPAE